MGFFTLLIFLFNCCRYPVLVAVDEWNAKFDKPKCQELFDEFEVQKLVGIVFFPVLLIDYSSTATHYIYIQNSGFWLYAVSSSFNPVKDVFQNADRQTLSVTIPRYTEAEINIILSCQKHFKRLPQSMLYHRLPSASYLFIYLLLFIIYLLLFISYLFIATDDEMIRYYSGFMPRMIFFWCEAWCGNLEEQFSVILQKYNTEAGNYYTERIIKTLARAAESGQERSQIYDIAAQVCLNIPVWNLPELWNISGLFIEVQREKDMEFACVCPPVTKAFMKNLSDQASNIISVMVLLSLSFFCFMSYYFCC